MKNDIVCNTRNRLYFDAFYCSVYIGEKKVWNILITKHLVFSVLVSALAMFRYSFSGIWATCFFITSKFLIKKQRLAIHYYR